MCGCRVHPHGPLLYMTNKNLRLAHRTRHIVVHQIPFPATPFPAREKWKTGLPNYSLLLIRGSRVHCYWNPGKLLGSFHSFGIHFLELPSSRNKASIEIVFIKHNTWCGDQEAYIGIWKNSARLEGLEFPCRDSQFIILMTSCLCVPAGRVLACPSYVRLQRDSNPPKDLNNLNNGN